MTCHHKQMCKIASYFTAILYIKFLLQIYMSEEIALASYIAISCSNHAAL